MKGTSMHPHMPKKAALKALVKAMKELDLAKVKGYKKADDDMPAIEATHVSKEQANKLKNEMQED